MPFPLLLKRVDARPSNPPQHQDGSALSRTTLQLIRGDAPSALKAIDELKRVPGVLTAELDIENDRATIAHDDGVTASSLLAAPRRAGIRARVLKGPPPSTIGFDLSIASAATLLRHLLIRVMKILRRVTAM